MKFSTELSEIIISFAEVKTYNTHRIIIKEGQKNYNLFYLLSGRCFAYYELLNCETSRWSENKIIELKEGDFIGEFHFADGLPASTSVKTVTDVKVLEINSKKLKKFLEINIGFKADFYEIMFQYVVEKQRQLNKVLDVTKY
jgi:CRP-like cAMP-binding protein